MIRYHEHIHLNSTELALFATLTGPGLPAPTSIVEYNQRLRAAANAWRNGRSQEESLLLEITEGLLLDEDEATPAANAHAAPACCG